MRATTQHKLTTAEIVKLSRAAEAMRLKILAAKCWEDIASLLRNATGITALTIANSTKLLKACGIEVSFRSKDENGGGSGTDARLRALQDEVAELRDRVKLLEECLGGTGTRA